MWSYLLRYASLGAKVKGIMAWNCSNGHTGGVCNVQGACHAASHSVSTSLGASASVDVGMQDTGVGIVAWGYDYNTYASKGIGARWNAQEVAGLASGGLETRVHTRATWLEALARMGAAKSIHRACNASSGKSVDTQEIHGVMVSTCLQRTGMVQNSLEVARRAGTILDKGLEGLNGLSPTWETPGALYIILEWVVLE
ncbi:hypothetical protein SLEP1_g40999 [Rubroshorea leprosula]|uniref:Uncharacterized protein n=1 Tax=Rubroshorea leprosula TaxID=152421 RepID=A0AAV5L5L1_9ROSI|nr:hypothetical protein SLEP1_g40999 [Rubroshorea leprosula]